jgi:hypothetical protein
VWRQASVALPQAQRLRLAADSTMRAGGEGMLRRTMQAALHTISAFTRRMGKILNRAAIMCEALPESGPRCNKNAIFPGQGRRSGFLPVAQKRTTMNFVCDQELFVIADHGAIG